MKRNDKRFVSVVLAVLLVGSLFVTAVSASYKRGSSGETVKQIQTKLKEWGYYDGTVDDLVPLWWLQ